MKLSVSKISVGVVSAFVISVVIAQDSSGPFRRSQDKFTPEAETAWKSQLDKIQKEIADLGDHSWAGTYYYGDGLGVNSRITLAPKGGFAFIWTGCVGVYDRNYGTVSLTERGSLKLGLTFENSRRGFRGVAEEFVPIAWGERHYLIPSDDVVGFTNSINSESEPRDRSHGSHYLRKGDHERPADGAPELPEQYQAYLLSEPIQAEVLAVEATIVEEGIGGWWFHKTMVTLNVGRSKNVLPGMSFVVYEPSDFLALSNARVITVHENTCEALINQSASDKIITTPPAVGWKFTTGSRFCLPVKQREEKENRPES